LSFIEVSQVNFCFYAILFRLVLVYRLKKVDFVAKFQEKKCYIFLIAIIASIYCFVNQSPITSVVHVMDWLIGQG